MNRIFGSKRDRLLAKAGVFLITGALIAAMVGCDGYNPAPSQNLEIRTWYDLDAIRDNLSGNHTLMNDLDSTTPGYGELASPTANAGKGWQPIGLYTPHGPTCCIGLAGTFDGQGYEIRDLFINRPDEDYVGLFKYVDRYYGIVKDISLTNVSVVGGNSVGSLVGYNFGTLSNCHCSGDVSGNSDVGGVAGGGNGMVTDSYFTGGVTGYEYVGGLVGYNFCDVSKSHFAGNATGHSDVGGLLGTNGATVSDCYCSGNVTGYEHVGGLIGFSFGGAVIDSYSTASVTGETGVGGLVGDNHWTQGSWSEDPWAVFLLPGVTTLGINVNNSYYDYGGNLINSKHIISIGALSSEDFNQWLANDKFLDINERLSQENGYYLINNVGDFKQLLAFGQNPNLKFRLTSDLDLAAEPGLYIPYLAGEFDGNGHRILNLDFNCGPVCYVGLFGYLAPGAAVTQVGADNVNINGASSVGGLVGQNYGTVRDSYSSGTVTGKKYNVGGLVGSNIESTVKVRNNEWNEWTSEGTVSNSYSTASVSGGEVVGGLVGSNWQGTLNSSYSTGDVTGYRYVGGLVGAGDVSDSYFRGSVTGQDGVGGLTGFGLGSNSYYSYDEVLINGENMITIGALSGEDFKQWLGNDKSLDANGKLSQEDGYHLIADVDDLKQLLAVGQNSSLKFRLTNDLDLATEPNFYIPYLAGEFDGNGHRISNLSFEFEFVSYVGLFGFLALGGNITRVGNENVNVAGNYYVGGLVGFNAGSVSYSYSTGSVTGNMSVGGLVGYNLGTVRDSRSAIDVTGDHRVGGLVGWNDYGLEGTNGIVSNSYSTGSVAGNWGVGGLVGVNYATVDASYSAGRVTGHDYVGGLAGLGGGTVSNSFWDRRISGRSFSDGGTGKTTAEMKNITTFAGAGWNILAVGDSDTRDPSYVWNIVDGVTYPFLSWQS
jgi:hypothetical protein